MATQVFDINHMLQRVQKVPITWVTNGLFGLCMVLIIYQSAYLTWSLLTSPSELAIDTIHEGTPKQPDSQSLASLEKLYLFGKPIEEVPEPIEDTAALSSLNLTVTGILLSSNPEDCIAVIRDDEGQNSYKIGDILPGGSEVISILHDRVIIRHRGVQEVLMLEQSPTVTPPVQKKRQQSRPQPETKLPMEEIMKDPMRILDFVNITPKNKDGVLVGYELHPGKDKEWFASSGLQDGDLAEAIKIKDYPPADLTKDEEMFKVMQELPEVDTAEVTVNRNGEKVVISVALN